MRAACRLVVSCCVLGLCWASGAPESRADDRVLFNRDIRPILSENCYKCHGPDKNQRKAGLRFDKAEGAVAKLESGRGAIVPGKAAESELLARITSADEGLHMPPLETGKRLTSQQIGLLKRWIEQGAAWQPHWSLITPTRPALPAVKNTQWPANAIDRFILARLEKEGLQPARLADKETLIRRVTYDLTGL